MIGKAVADTYGRKGGKVVEMNIRAAELAVERISASATRTPCRVR
jgi:Pyruvate/2-oxoacid:ferredoxin oxidoreductase gamma subunit